MRKPLPRLRSALFSVTKSLGIVALGFGLATQVPGVASANPKYAAFVIDANNGRVLYEEDADDYRYPASLTKMMTLYMTFEALEQGRVRLDSAMPVSAYAAGRPPSKLGMKPGSTLSVEDAIKGLVTKSANDASVVLAEFLAGSEDRFASAMTQKARRIGMSKTTFRNANGLPDDGQRTTARDMATLGIALREHFPQYYKYFSTRSYSFRGRTVNGHNRVLDRVKGVDGIKTGYIRASGFNLVSSVVRGDKKLVAVVMGGRSGRSRDDHMVELLTRYLPAASSSPKAGQLVASAPATLGGPPATAASAVGVATLASIPVPGSRPMEALSPASIDQRVAMAYGTSAADAVSAMPVPNERPLMGRDALRAALVEERPAVGGLQVPTAQPLPRERRTPAAAVTGGSDLDPTTTGVVAARESSPSSAWVIQIAASPSREQALEMLAEAKAKAGLRSAEPFTESVGNGSSKLYRARFAGFQTKDEAWSACASLKKKSYSCYAVAN
ncbi:SPOR domain-containing protein [Antarcticirhabdus aurantiaca]|uniref:SPOR domain-containing protein n=1 Tax=Antarcticirhabdus aurantiaca TaxID=2606717 RepID=UPI003BB767A9